MNRNRHGGGRDRGGRHYGGGDGLLGEGPGMGGNMYEPMMNNQMNQLLLAQQLLQQQQAALSGAGGFGGGAGEFGELGLGALAGAMGNMPYLQQSQGMGFGGGGMGGMRNDRKRVGGQGRDMDIKRRRRDSLGRGGDRDRSRGRDSNRSGEGRDRNRSSRWDTDRDREKYRSGKGGDDYDPAEPTEDEELKDKDSNLYCHVCNVSVYDDDSFRRHLNGTKHTQRMNSVLTVHQMKSNQLKSRLKAEEHLRKIEGKKGGIDPDYFCKICNNSLTIPWERHRFSNIHKQRQLQVKRGCGWCNVHDFNNFTEVLKHRETEEHKKNAEIYGKKKEDKERGRSRSRSRDRKHRSQRRSSSRDRSKKDKDKKVRDKDRKKEEEEEDLTIPEFSPDNPVPVGLNYIIPVTGFFCKLCHKFYNNEKSAKGAHCESEAHYERLKLATEAKIAAREKRRAEEAAAEAERKAREEEEAKKIKEEVTETTDKSEEQKKDETNGELDEGHKEEVEEDEEDYDDDLPLEDEDDEGGLVKDEDELNLESEMTTEEGTSLTTSAGESLLQDTNADSSFTFLSGDMAEAHMQLQRQEQLQQKKTEPSASASNECQNDLSAPAQLDVSLDDEAEAADTLDDGNTTGMVDTSMDLSGEGEDKEDSSSVVPGDDDLVATSTPLATNTAKSTGKARGGGTARRGRGRGKKK